MGSFNSRAPPRAPESSRGGDSFSGGNSRFSDRKPEGGGDFGRGDRDRDSNFSSRYGGGDSRSGGGSSFGERSGGGGFKPNNFVSDPRFNFSGSSSGGHGGDNSSHSAPLATLGPTAEELKALEDIKKAKAAKAAERAEAEQKVKDAKEAAKEAAAAALEKAISAAQVAVGAADEALKTGLKGEPLMAHIQGMEVKPSGAALAEVVLKSLSDPLSTKWVRPAEYGSAIKFLLGGDSKLQLALIRAIQIHLHGLKFPKVDDKGKKTSVIHLLFYSLYNFEIVDPAGFALWADDDDDSNGKTDAIVQTTSFYDYLREEEEGGDEEEEDDDEIDAPRPTVK